MCKDIPGRLLLLGRALYQYAMYAVIANTVFCMSTAQTDIKLLSKVLHKIHIDFYVNVMQDF